MPEFSLENPSLKAVHQECQCYIYMGLAFAGKLRHLPGDLKQPSFSDRPTRVLVNKQNPKQTAGTHTQKGEHFNTFDPL